MVDTIRIKRRAAGGAAGAPPSLAAAELAYNEQDDTLYYGKGNSAGSATNIIAIGGSATTITSLLNLFTSALKGLVPSSGGGTTNFLRADGTWIAPPGGTTDPPVGGILFYSSATALKFTPYNGKMIQINGTQLQIPNAGIAGLTNTAAYVNGISGTSLAINTTYFVYAFNNAGTITADFRTDGVGHMTDTTTGNEGVEVRASAAGVPDSTRTLIGLIRTIGPTPGKFVDSASQRFVRSWFNRNIAALQGSVLSNTTTASTTWVELGSGHRVEWVNFSGETIQVNSSGAMWLSTTGALGTGIGLDATNSSTAPDITLTAPAGNPQMCYSTMFFIAPAEGYHYAVAIGAVSAGTGTWVAPTFAGGQGPYLTGRVG